MKYKDINGTNFTEPDIYLHSSVMLLAKIFENPQPNTNVQDLIKPK